MELSPEERRRIYEEEKTRLEAREQIEREKQGMSRETSTGLMPHIEGLLCYLGGWVTGLIFFILEQKNNWVRFHAAQSIVTFGILTVATALLGWIPFVGPVFTAIIWIIGFVLWIVLMVKAHSGERYHLAWAGDIAERMVVPSGTTYDDRYDYKYEDKTPPPPPGPEAPSAAPPRPSEPPPPAGMRWEDRMERRAERFFRHRREGRITASAFAIAWSIILLVFFNFYNGYVALYSQEIVGGVATWTRQPFFTSALGLWLPILNATLVISIIGHIVMIIFDRHLIRQVVHIVIDVFVLATVVSLLAIYPFDFSIIPNSAVATGVNIGVIISLVFVMVGVGIGILVRVIRLIVNLAGVVGSGEAR